jgi:glycosyltransferase involved in cell wall biosynthesis
MRHTVLSVAYPFSTVGPDAVGGSEQILTELDRGLTAAGHNSVVIAAKGSKVRGTLVPGPEAEDRLDDSIRENGQRIHKQLIREALARFPIDLIHMHALDFHRYLPDGSTPILATLHLPPDWYPPEIHRLKRRHFYLNCVSSTQRRACPNSPLLLASISNGVDVKRLGIKDSPRKFVLALGRICPEKGFHLALDAAKQAHVEMILAGQVFPYKSHLKYFREKIVPRLDRWRRYVGPVGFQQKRKLLSQARCLLVTSSVAETSSLVTMEALACGTPVIAYPSGALPEIVDHKRTGFLVSNIREMAQAILQVAEIDRDTCRGAARTRFTSESMIRNYLEVYDRIINKARLDEPERLTPGRSWLVA